jgi:hypothetical protein
MWGNTNVFDRVTFDNTVTVDNIVVTTLMTLANRNIEVIDVDVY